MWGCALGPFEASALMATSPRKKERKKEESRTEKSLAPITVRVRRTTSFRVSADLKCRLLVTEETSTQSSARYGVLITWQVDCGYGLV